MARTNQSQAEIQALVQGFTDQLTQLVRRTALEQVHSALGQIDGAAGARRGRKPARRTGARPGRRSPRRSAAAVEQMAGRLLAFVKKNPGRRGEQISKALRTDVGTMRLPMKSLIAQKKVKTKGQRRGMTYFAA